MHSIKIYLEISADSTISITKANTSLSDLLSTVFIRSEIKFPKKSKRPSSSKLFIKMNKQPKNSSVLHSTLCKIDSKSIPLKLILQCTLLILNAVRRSKNCSI